MFFLFLLAPILGSENNPGFEVTCGKQVNTDPRGGSPNGPTFGGSVDAQISPSGSIILGFCGHDFPGLSGSHGWVIISCFVSCGAGFHRTEDSQQCTCMCLHRQFRQLLPLQAAASGFPCMRWRAQASRRRHSGLVLAGVIASLPDAKGTNRLELLLVPWVIKCMM